ncbi:hypothetical protein BCR34DRAFT_149994 [Clohesyomyces aquaticus]|uniref:Uncharacterized protein n=1 Tax=Clohesyomyces aquaticus TaxID=1231657 RepID=A0A1Y1YKJ3_9PLEO|nr:hypothetical protein BCR34DRAFT_149994 [Clohesyomyces aquaticus]
MVAQSHRPGPLHLFFETGECIRYRLILASCLRLALGSLRSDPCRTSPQIPSSSLPRSQQLAAKSRRAYSSCSRMPYCGSRSVARYQRGCLFPFPPVNFPTNEVRVGLVYVPRQCHHANHFKEQFERHQLFL